MFKNLFISKKRGCDSEAILFPECDPPLHFLEGFFLIAKRKLNNVQNTQVKYISSKKGGLRR